MHPAEGFQLTETVRGLAGLAVQHLVHLPCLRPRAFGWPAPQLALMAVFVHGLRPRIVCPVQY
jgi:hypothetical protein